MSGIHISNGDLSADLPHNTNIGGGAHSAPGHAEIAPGEIAIGVVIGRASEYFDFFVYAMASVLVFPSVFFPFEQRLEGTLYAFVIFALPFWHGRSAPSSSWRFSGATDVRSN